MASNANFTHTLMGSEMSVIKGKGITLDSSMKMLIQWVAIVERANSMLDITRKWVENKT